MKKLIWYIHGANSSPKSFNWIKDNLPEHDAEFVYYAHEQSINHTIEELIEKAKRTDRPIDIVGHSLGGVIAARVAQQAPINKIVTLSTPFGGVKGANFMQFFTPGFLMSDISPQNLNFVNLQLHKPETPILSFVSSIDTFLNTGTDGVVSVGSQKALPYATYIEVKINHFEVLLSPEILDRMKAFLF